ncbi:efflux RND transporter periplasmic adaptor subunit [Flavobacterium columnare NBRC 100251 = ATCC 23463]|uniref:RND family efflux transporter MFP subunit n=2 Tax=Flavobacterium columnare TaxID=996 RepID=G8X4L7_FLACA|nr:efflux RND transporter periplasmic adaptor subunit [Flavobacterium columnare]AEW85442.1 RND family efflux transporter MFP subunit [Flavobacterium columnare ATCC 49512]AMO20152.1 efflux RND transporter periplasmic adaptor subunit [Flavobacterium columnare]ANO49365.1 RND family efflux transporter MFP subunit [Flavobacterium columnare]APT22666.1 efflux transporter periplasmic adaptor subunit [Flavobacterium columnare]AUX18103.1 RND transporter [Flavobacterium columnare]
MNNIKSRLKFFLLINTFILILLTSCKENKTDGSNEEKKSENEVALTLVQYKTIGIEIGKIEHKNLNSAIKASGYTTVPPQNKADVSTLINGVIKDIFVLEGTYVTKGKVLATIQNLEVTKIQEDYQTAIANIEYLQLEYNRQKTLSDEDVNPKKTFQEVKSKLAVERAKAQAAKNKLQALNISLKGSTSLIPILAPISGYVGKINITKGSFADTGLALFEVVNNSEMHLDLNVYEKDLDKIAIGQEVDFILTNQSNRIIKGKIFGINKSFSNESKTVAVHAKINSSDSKELITGMYVNANINVTNQTVQALPKDAVVRNGEKYYIYLQEDSHQENPKETHQNKEEEENEIHFKAIEVVPGPTDLGYTEIKLIDPVPSTAKVVTKGAFYLLSQSKGGGEHEH